MTKHGITMIATATAMAMGIAATAVAAEPAGKRSVDGEAPAAEEPASEAMPAPAPVYVPESDVVPIAPKPVRWAPASKLGMSIMGGGGVTNFTGNTASDATNVGGSWTARFAVGTRRWVGFEGAYIGGTNSLNNLLTTNEFNTTRLNRNGLEGALRLNAPLYAKNTLLSPYLLGGVGWNSYRLSNFNAATSDVSLSSGNDNTVSIPLGTGFSVGYKGFIADVRYTIRPTYGQQTFLNASSGGLTNWDAGGMVGYEF
jgi:hypothetical protein